MDIIALCIINFVWFVFPTAIGIISNKKKKQKPITKSLKVVIKCLIQRSHPRGRFPSHVNTVHSGIYYLLALLLVLRCFKYCGNKEIKQIMSKESCETLGAEKVMFDQQNTNALNSYIWLF